MNVYTNCITEGQGFLCVPPSQTHLTHTLIIFFNTITNFNAVLPQTLQYKELIFKVQTTDSADTSLHILYTL